MFTLHSRTHFAHNCAHNRTEPFPSIVGAQWGTDVVIGFTDPALSVAP
jgi:hypothetical protein